MRRRGFLGFLAAIPFIGKAGVPKELTDTLPNGWEPNKLTASVVHLNLFVEFWPVPNNAPIWIWMCEHDEKSFASWADGSRWHQAHPLEERRGACPNRLAAMRESESCVTRILGSCQPVHWSSSGQVKISGPACMQAHRDGEVWYWRVLRTRLDRKGAMVGDRAPTLARAVEHCEELSREAPFI